MNRLADTISRALEPDEREAVLGDLTESGDTGGQALRDLIGLIARRQAALWKDWRPWLALGSLAIPLGMLLSREARHLADGSAVYLWMYANNWTPTYLENAGFRMDLLRDFLTFVMDYLELIFWSWTAGFALGSLSRGAIWINGAVFCVLLAGELAAVHPRGYGANAAAFAVGFYRLVLPSILRIALVLIPSVHGMYQGARRIALKVSQLAWWSAALAGLTAWRHLTIHWGPRMLLTVAIAWPVVYMIASADWKRRDET